MEKSATMVQDYGSESTPYHEVSLVYQFLTMLFIHAFVPRDG